MPFCNVKGQYLKIVKTYHGVKLCYPDITIQNPDREMFYPDLIRTVTYSMVMSYSVIIIAYYCIIMQCSDIPMQ